VARNRKARFDYHIEETWEAGLVLTGTEIKSVRAGKVSLKGAYGVVRGNEVWLEGLNIAKYDSGGYTNHDPERRRKLLMHRREVRGKKVHDKREDVKRRDAERDARRAMGRRE
jgi:SsrA-binding protein